MRNIVLILAMMSGALVAGAPVTGSVTCPSSGSLVVLATSVKAVTYTILMPVTNTGNVCIGGPNVTVNNSPCYISGQSITAPPQGNAAAYDLHTVYFACTVNTDVIKYVYQ